MRFLRVLLVIIAVVCIGVAISYPIRYRQARDENNANMDELAAMRQRARQEAGIDVTDTAPGVPDQGGAVGADEEDVPVGVPTRPTRPPEGAEAGWDGGATSNDGAGQSSGANGAELSGQSADAGTSADAGAQGPSGGGQSPDSGAQGQSGGQSPDSGAQGQSGGQSQNTGAQGQSGGGQSQSTGAQSSGGDSMPTDVEAVAGETFWPDEPTPEPEPTPTPEPTPVPTPTPEPTPVAYPDLELLRLDGFETPTPTPGILAEAGIDVNNLDYAQTPEPSPTPVWDEYTGPLPYSMLEKVTLDESRILPELREIYALNHDLVGWVNIPGTVIDYPVVQCQDSDFYLEHDFYGNENINGQIILDTLCDPYTPSYNLILSGHHMKNGSMFGDLPLYLTKGYWEKHKVLEFDTLMERKLYVVFAAFYSADYDEDEEGFRYNADIQYNMEAKHWLAEIRDNQLYDTEIDVEFGDEFITLTTCNRARHKNGRFVVVCRKIREGETIE